MTTTIEQLATALEISATRERESALRATAAERQLAVATTFLRNIGIDATTVLDELWTSHASKLIRVELAADFSALGDMPDEERRQVVAIARRLVKRGE